MLKKLQLAKEMFILDMENGQEVIVPPELSMDQMPMNFRYYDPILLWIQEMFASEKKQYFILKNQFTFQRIKDDDVKAKVLEKIGVTSKTDGKLTIKPA